MAKVITINKQLKELVKERKRAISVAKQLKYDDEHIELLQNASSSIEISQILANARMHSKAFERQDKKSRKR